MVDLFRTYVRSAITLALAFVALVAAAWQITAYAQTENEAADRSWLISTVENQISTPNMQFRLNNIQGVLSSDATIGEITIADRQDVWLRITNARIVWTRSALLLGRLDIETLRADRIDVLRRPLPAEGLPAAETSGFAIPELPVSVALGQLQVDRVVFGDGVFGLASEISVGGRLQLADGSMDTGLDITRLDGPGGQLRLAATYANASREMSLDFTLAEPANGVVANLVNVEGRPPMALAMKGAGPLDSLKVDLTLDADSQRVLTGVTTLDQQAEGLVFNSNVEGPISRLISPVFRDFFGADSKLAISGIVRDAGGVLVDNIDLASGAMSLKGNAETAADGFLRQLNLKAEIADANAQRVVLPVAGGETTVERASFDLSFGEQGENWSGNLDLNKLDTGTFSSQDVHLDLSGLAQNLDRPTDRRITFKVTGAATGMDAKRADVKEALGDRVDLDIDGSWRAGQPIDLPRAQLSANGVSAGLAGAIAEMTYRGRIDLKAETITPFSALANRELAGGLEMVANGEVKLIGGGLNLTLDGTGSGLKLDQQALDNLIQGTTRITGRVERGENGLVADKLRLFNDQVDILADGRYATGTADFNLDLALSDLALISERASGRLTAKGTAAGQDGVIALKFNADAPQGRLADKNLRDLKLGFDGFARNQGVDGRVSGDAFLDGNRVLLTGDVVSGEQGASLTNLNFQAGGATAQGDLRRGTDGLINGELRVDAADVSTAAALATVKATGAAVADVRLAGVDGQQQADISAQVRNLVTDGARVSNADVKATIADLFNVPVVNGTVRGGGISAGGINVTTIDAEATAQGQATSFSANAALDNGTTIHTRGGLAPEAGGYRVNLSALDLAQGRLTTSLAEPASVLVQGQNVTVDAFTLNAAGGRVAVRGTAAEQLNLNVDIMRLPLAIANAIKPDLELGGTLDGTATVRGPRSTPDVNFDVNGRQISAAALKQAGLSALTLNAKGTSSAERLNLDASVTSPEGLRASARGGVPLAETGQLDVDVDLNAFPLAVLNARVPGQQLAGSITGTAKVTGRRNNPAVAFNARGTGVRATALAGLAPLQVTAEGRFADQMVTLSGAQVRGANGFAADANGTVPLDNRQMALNVDLSALPLSAFSARLPGLAGTVSGTARVSGTRTDPAATFEAQGNGIRATVLNEAGIAPLEFTAQGSFADNAVTLNSAGVRGPQGLTVDGRGRVPLQGGGLDVSVNGDAPLSLANRFLADRGAQVSGNLTLSASVSGSTQQPVIRGMFSTQGAQFVDPESNVRLNQIAVMGTIDGDQINLRSASAALGAGGRVSASGNISTNAGAGFPADIQVTLDNARYADGNMVVATVNGALRLTGPVVRDALLSGNIDVARAEITVPDSLGGGAANIDVKHKKPSKKVQQTLKRAKADERSKKGERSSNLRLNVTVNAENKIFVRGRGLDTELGGRVTLTGPVTNIEPVGGFRLIRGRLSIIGQRIDFDEGTVTLVGDLDPFIDFVARSEGSDITVFITVRGRVSDLDITFSSQPELPQDEVLARLIFNRSINELSAFQIAQLAAAAAELAGGRQTSLMGSLRNATGLDDIDVVTDKKGNAAVRAGRYINDNIYLGVEAGAGGGARGTINLDITEGLKAKGAVGSDGDSSIGIFYEKDY